MNEVSDTLSEDDMFVVRYYERLGHDDIRIRSGEWPCFLLVQVYLIKEDDRSRERDIDIQ